ncbi:uncharacterized protein N7459_001072 [Penicillium hispanicum]|uniref:uncharacterized protein n=1 Tax=Penicillium hispanicum TaxID=1080232 RepID=UPI002540727A|nr:uncharacterized protein N7459_001072 [Penicillium hispanicum]KAJ5594864.1 hypothetical protein N7459_001072 [Penicillium hispanicum]
MATVDDADPVFYPAFCFKASPTHSAWVKMAAADVHRLQRLKGFEGQRIFFYKNHPIRFVSVVGLIVARTEVPRRTILTLDDSSGMTLDITVLQSKPNDKTPTATAQAQTSASHVQPQAPRPSNTVRTGLDTAEDTPDLLQPGQPVHLSATNESIIDIAQLVPGTMVKVKGTLSRFRDTMQLNLERFALVRDTNAEMQFVDERLQFLVRVLAVPWVLLGEEVEQLRRDAEQGDLKAVEERRRAERKMKRRAEREERDARHIQRRYEREERRREKEAAVCMEDGARVMADIRRKRVASAD